MKTKSIILSVFMLLSITAVSAQSKKDSNKEKVVFDVYMDCQSCKNKIEKNIPFEKGVKNLDMDLEQQTVAVTYDNRKTDVETLQSAFKKLGYEAKVPQSACCSDKKPEGCSKDKEADSCKEHGHAHAK